MTRRIYTTSAIIVEPDPVQFLRDTQRVNAVMDRAWNKYVTSRIPDRKYDWSDGDLYIAELALVDAIAKHLIKQYQPLQRRIHRRAHRANNFTPSPYGGLRHTSMPE